MASSNLAGPGANPGRPVLHVVRRGPERLGYLLERAAFGLCGSTPRIRPHPMTATQTFTLLRAGADPVIDY